MDLPCTVVLKGTLHIDVDKSRPGSRKREQDGREEATEAGRSGPTRDARLLFRLLRLFVLFLA